MADTPAEPPALTNLSLAAQSGNEEAVKTATASERVDQDINPFSVSGGVVNGVAQAIDYDKLIDKFGTKRIDKALLERFEKVTGKRPHKFMRRGIVFSHRDLEIILNRYEAGSPFFLYTGRGPSSGSVHLGHMVPFGFTLWLHEVFDVPLVIELTDDEKYLHKPSLGIENIKSFTRDNAKDIIAVGFDPKKTFIFTDLNFMGGRMYENVVKISNYITTSQAKATFGFTDSDSIGKIHFAAVQASPSLATSFPAIFPPTKETPSIPALIPCAIDQDPYFRLTRDVCPKMRHAKPSLIHSVFLPALQGEDTKMSSSIDSTAIFMTDTPQAIKKKINKYAFSGGQTTAEEQRKLGGNPDVDISFRYLTFFLEDDDELERIRTAYRKGEMLTGELKALCIKELQTYVTAYQERRSKVTDEILDGFMEPRGLTYGGNPHPVKAEPKATKKT